MAALAVVSDYIDDTRVLLQDLVSPYRYSDAQLAIALSVTMLEVRRLRPDLFLGDGTTTLLSDIPSYTVSDSTAVSIEPAFRTGVLYGMCAHALMRDQEDQPEKSAKDYMDNFLRRMVAT